MVRIIDVTNRDGVQTSRILLSKLAKTMLNLYLDKMGVFQSEIGFPTLRHEVGYINANLELAERGAISHLRLQGWCRALPEDVRLAFSNCPGLKHITLSASSSDTMIRAKFGGRKDWNSVRAQMMQAVRRALECGAETVCVGAEDASRTDEQRLIELIGAAKEAGAVRFRYSDTVGIGDPFTTYERIRHICVTTRMPVEMHCHNDLGMAVGSSLAGARAAADVGVDAYIDTTINGYGERAGNADLVSMLLALRHAEGFRNRGLLAEQSDLSVAWHMANYASYAFNIPIPINQPGVGDNIFAHESGIHADSTLKSAGTYELFQPEEIGRGTPVMRETGRIITTGAYGGLKGFRHVYEKLGVSFGSDEAARRVLGLVQLANLHTQKPLTDDELLLIARHPDIVARILTIQA